jgi:uncharacterized protein YjlB
MATYPRISSILVPPSGHFPNNPRLPLLLYEACNVQHRGDAADWFLSTFRANGWTEGGWLDG